MHTLFLLIEDAQAGSLAYSEGTSDSKGNDDG